MSPTRVGDTWMFDVPDMYMPVDQTKVKIGVLPEESYHVMITAQLDWTDPDVLLQPGEHRLASVQLDLDGLVLPTGTDPDTVDVTTLDYRGDFDSNTYAHYTIDAYDAPAGTSHQAALVAQGVFDFPPETILVFSCAGSGEQVTDGLTEMHVTAIRAVFTVITSQ